MLDDAVDTAAVVNELLSPRVEFLFIRGYKLHTYRVVQKLTPLVLYGFFYALISSDRFSNLFHYGNQENICSNTVAKDPTTPQMCRYTTLWNVSVLIATTENKTSPVATRFKKLTTGNKVFIVSVII